MELIETIMLPLAAIETNAGQVEGLPANPRLIKDDKYKKLVASIAENPEMLALRELLVYEYKKGKYVTIGGNMRREALKELKYKEAPCKVIPKTATIEQLKAYTIKDNSGFGEWDWDLLGNEWDDMPLAEWGVDMPTDMAGQMGEQPTAEEDNFDEGSVTENICNDGDLWKLGNHRLLCGDSTEASAVTLLMDGEKADMVFTDPPYNMNYCGAGFINDTNQNVKHRIKDIIDFDPDGIKYLANGTIAPSVFIFTSKDLIKQYLTIFDGWMFNLLMWHKTNTPPMVNNNYFADTEYLLYFHKGQRVWNNGLKPIDIYKKYFVSSMGEGKKDAGEDLHPTMKPIKLIGNEVLICSNKGGIVVDVFGGSGSTLIAAEQLNRKCYMMELDPHYCDVIISRWEQLTGQKAELIKNINEAS